MSTGSDLLSYPGESFSQPASAFFCFRLLQRKNARIARAIRAMGMATAGAIIEAFDFAGAGVSDGEAVEAGAATMLGLDVVTVLEPPSDLVMIEVRRTMLVED